VSREAARTLALDGDLVMIHDPQPAALAMLRRKPGQQWVWRCHIDLSHRTPEAWEFLEPHLLYYDAAICSHPDFASGLPIPGFLSAPSIDPLSDKNRALEESEIEALLAPFDLPTNTPIVTQVSRFDRLKDPVGVVDAFRLARRRTRAHLLLAGGTADDDPEGAVVLAEVKQRVGDARDVTLLSLPPDSHLAINAMQRRSTVVLQKSLREGFALTVSEALWKDRAVVASAVGGIPLQILHNRTGLLVRSIEGCALQMLRLLHGPALRRRLGRAGHEHVRAHFLHPREGRDYLALFLHLLRREQAVKHSG
jgi:trehalose synthase